MLVNLVGDMRIMLKTASAPVTYQLSYECSWTETKFNVPKTSSGVSTGTFFTTIVPRPSSGQTIVKSIKITNLDDAQAIVTLIIKTPDIEALLYTAILESGQFLYYAQDIGWMVDGGGQGVEPRIPKSSTPPARPKEGDLWIDLS